MPVHPVLIDGKWRPSTMSGTFRAENPATCQPLPDEYPVSSWADCDAALTAATKAAQALSSVPAESLAKFLERYADQIDAASEQLVETAHQETALAKSPRLSQVELPRTTNQLRQAAAAARNFTWQLPTIDTKLNIRSCLGPVGPVLTFGPNNFPFAYEGIAGGDFAAAIAAGNPVIAKAHTSHPSTARLFAEIAARTADEVGLPTGTVQMIYRLSHEDGERFVSDHRVGAIGYTGSRSAGLKLKAAADATGKPIYLELSSVNPVVILPGILREKLDAVVEEFCGSCLMATGQFCTNPGMLILLAGPETDAFLAKVADRFASAPIGTLLSSAVVRSLQAGVATLKAAGAEILTGGTAGGGTGHSHANTLMKVSGEKFLAQPEQLQTEAFGNASLAVVAQNAAQAGQILERLEGNLTGSIYSSSSDADEKLYAELAPRLRARVGRLLNDKMPTGVAVTAAMNHGGPYPATGHAGFTAVGFPAAIRRFAQLQCYENVRPNRLPIVLQNANPNGTVWRFVDGVWSQG